MFVTRVNYTTLVISFALKDSAAATTDSHTRPLPDTHPISKAERPNRQIHRQTDRQTGRPKVPTNGPTDRHTDRQTEKKTNRKMTHINSRY